MFDLFTPLTSWSCKGSLTIEVVMLPASILSVSPHVVVFPGFAQNRQAYIFFFFTSNL